MDANDVTQELAGALAGAEVDCRADSFELLLHLEVKQPSVLKTLRHWRHRCHGKVLNSLSLLYAEVVLT
jgi:hypothetical protein